MNKHILKKIADLEGRVSQSESNQRLQDELFRLRREEREQAISLNEQVVSNLSKRMQQYEQRLAQLEQGSTQNKPPQEPMLIKKAIKQLVNKVEQKW